MAGPFPFPKIQFFKPDILFWEYVFGRRTPKRLNMDEVDIGQLGLREEFAARECDRPKGTPHHYFLVRFDGPMNIWMDGEWADAPPGSTVLWAPGNRHRYGVTSGRAVTHSYVFVAGRMVASLMRSLALPSNKIVAGVSAESFETHLFAITQEYLRNSPQGVVIENCLSNLLHSVAGDLRPAGLPRKDYRLLEVKRVLDLHFYRRHSLTELARRAHCNPAYLSDRFKRTFGTSPIEYVIGLRMSHARNLLSATDLPIKQVAAQTGYDDPYYFSRLFRKYCGCSPKHYRTRHDRKETFR